MHKLLPVKNCVNDIFILTSAVSFEGLTNLTMLTGDARIYESDSSSHATKPFYGHESNAGPMPTSGAPPSVQGFQNSLPNMQGPSNASGAPMYPQGGAFNRTQAGQMPMTPGFNPYQV